MLTPRLRRQFSLNTLTPLVFLFSLLLTQNTFAAEPLPPEVTKVETFREGALVFFRLYYTDPNNDAEGFGFRGINGSGWAEEEHPFSSPSYGRWSPGIIEYPFKLGCGTQSEYESDVEAWIYDSTGLRGASVTVHLACSAPEPGAPLATKQVTVGLDILQSNNIPLENLTVSTLLSEDVIATGDITANVAVADANKGQIAFVSTFDENLFLVAYISSSDIQSGATSITLDSIADGFIMLNPLMSGFREPDRQEILAHAKNIPMYQDLKNEINTALQTDPFNLLEYAIFPKTYEYATNLINDVIKNIGKKDLSQAVAKATPDITSNAIIGKTDEPHLNDLGGGKVEVVNPTMVFYGFDIAEQPLQTRVISGKEALWNSPVKETIELGRNVTYNITFSKINSSGLTDIGTSAAVANFVKLNCILIDLLAYCPASNKTIESVVEPQDKTTLELLENDLLTTVTSLQEVINKLVDIIKDQDKWSNTLKILFRIGVGQDAANILQNERVIKLAKAYSLMLKGYESLRVYLPFIADGLFKRDTIKYCVTESNGVLSETCQPTDGIPIITKVEFPSSIVGDHHDEPGKVYFTDSNAGVNWAQFDVASHTCEGDCGIESFAFEPPGVSDFTEGWFGFYMWCETKTDFSWITEITLRDIEGHVSDPYTLSVQCAVPGQSIAR